MNRSNAGPGDIQMPAEHEFNVMENDVIGGLGGCINVVAVISIIFGMLQGVLGLVNFNSVQGMLMIASGVCLIVIGGWLLGASTSFKQIVATEGNDITLLMDALKKLRSAYTLQGVLLIVASVLVAVVLILAIRTSHQ